MSRWRKAFWAGVGAAASAFAVGISTEVPQTQAGWLALVGAAVGAGITVGLATYNVPNEPPAAGTGAARTGGTAL